MSNVPFYIQYEEIRSCTFAEFASRLRDVPKKPIGDLQISELCSTSSANGLYFMFFPDGRLAYVGKASSRSFIERIPSHFDQREEAWMNSVPKKVLKQPDVGDYAEALHRVLKFQIVLMGFEDRKMSIKLESALRGHLQPRRTPVERRITAYAS